MDQEAFIREIKANDGEKDVVFLTVTRVVKNKDQEKLGKLFTSTLQMRKQLILIIPPTSTA
ncbi:MAG: hypothetical protein ABF649_22905 [Bacillus sp. (in: firmicutes)]